MTSEIFGRKYFIKYVQIVILASLILVLLTYYPIQIAKGQNSTVTDTSDSASDQASGAEQNEPDSGANNSNSTNSANRMSRHEAQEPATNSTSQHSRDGSYGEQTQNSTSATSNEGEESHNPETDQTSAAISEEQTSGNTTYTTSNVNQNSTDTAQNNTFSSAEQQADTQSTNSTYSGNATAPESGNSTGYNTQTMNGNATSNSYQNATAGGSYQNDTGSAEQLINSSNVQSTNETHSANMTTSQNSTDYGSNSTVNENVTASLNESMNLTDSVAAIQNTTSLPPPDFDIDIDPLVASIDAGSSASYTITVSSINGFSSDVSLSITSDSIAGITAALSSNMTRPPANASSTLFLDVQSDPAARSGKYKLKVTASSANMSDSSASVKLEVLGQEPAAPVEQDLQFDPIALTPVLIKDLHDSIINDISSDRMVLISTTVTNNYNKTQPFIVVVEVRDEAGATLYLQLQKGVLNPLGEVEVAISWTPEKAGMYQVRTFVIDNLEKDPEPLSAPVGKTVEVK